MVYALIRSSKAAKMDDLNLLRGIIDELREDNASLSDNITASKKQAEENSKNNSARISELEKLISENKCEIERQNEIIANHKLLQEQTATMLGIYEDRLNYLSVVAIELHNQILANDLIPAKSLPEFTLQLARLKNICISKPQEQC